MESTSIDWLSDSEKLAIQKESQIGLVNASIHLINAYMRPICVIDAEFQSAYIKAGDSTNLTHSFSGQDHLTLSFLIHQRSNLIVIISFKNNQIDLKFEGNDWSSMMYTYKIIYEKQYQLNGILLKLAFNEKSCLSRLLSPSQTQDIQDFISDYYDTFKKSNLQIFFCLDIRNAEASALELLHFQLYSPSNFYEDPEEVFTLEASSSKLYIISCINTEDQAFIKASFIAMSRGIEQAHIEVKYDFQNKGRMFVTKYRDCFYEQPVFVQGAEKDKHIFYASLTFLQQTQS